MLKPIRYLMFITLLITFLSACRDGDGGALSPPDTDLTGNWGVVETVTSSNCPEEGGAVSYSVEVTQDGNQLIIFAPNGIFAGEISGSSINWLANYIDSDDSTIDSNVSLTVDDSGNRITGTATWTATYVGGSCNGTNSIVANRTSGGGLSSNNEIEPNPISNPQTISVNAEMRGQVSGARMRFPDSSTLNTPIGFDPGEDYDAFTFTVTSGGVYSFNLKTNGEDLDLYLFNPDINLLIALSDASGGSDENIDNLLTDANSTFVLVVVPWDLSLSTGNGNYTLTITQR